MTPTQGDASERRPAVPWRAIAAITVLGAVVRLIPVLSADFPLNDGGLFAEMILAIRANGFALPAAAHYNAHGSSIRVPASRALCRRALVRVPVVRPYHAPILAGRREHRLHSAGIRRLPSAPQYGSYGSAGHCCICRHAAQLQLGDCRWRRDAFDRPTACVGSRRRCDTDVPRSRSPLAHHRRRCPGPDRAEPSAGTPSSREPAFASCWCSSGTSAGGGPSSTSGSRGLSP